MLVLCLYKTLTPQKKLRCHGLVSLQGYAEKILTYQLETDALHFGSATNGGPTSAAAGGEFGVGLSPDIVRGIDSLWHDPIIPSVLDRSNEFYMMDSAA